MFLHTLSKNIIRIVSAAMLATQLCCYKLWTAHLGFPSLPVASIFGGWPEWIHLALFGGSLLLMLITMVKPVRAVIGTLLFLQLLLCLSDQNRWQPWEYQYLFMLGACFFVKGEEQLKWGWQFIMISTYFFSSIWKFQPAFIHDVWLGYILRGWLHIYEIPSWAFRAGYILPSLELIGAVFLCFNKTRRVGMSVLIGMHLFVLVMMGPFGLFVNYVLWPWNVGMILLLFYLFYRQDVAWQTQLLKPAFNVIVLVCWGILPWFNGVGYWDRYLSSVLFSGGAPYLYISTSHPAALERFGSCMSKNSRLPYQQAVSTYSWGSQDLSTIPYPERRNFKHIARYWMTTFQDSSARFFIIRSGFQPSYVELRKEELK